MVLLAAGGLLMSWLFHSPNLHRQHDLSFTEFGAAALGFLCLSAGALLTTLGEHVFDQVEISERWARRPPSSSQGRRDKSAPAFLVVPDNDFISSTSRAISDDTAIRRASNPWAAGGGNANG